MGLLKLYQSYRNFKPFTADEAWMLFKLAAISEGIGWTLLIIGIFCRSFILPGNQIPVLLAGRVHGVLFIIYIAATLLLAPSLKWSLLKTIIAGLCSIPPYGSVVFELLVGKQKQFNDLSTLTAYIRYWLFVQYIQ